MDPRNEQPIAVIVDRSTSAAEYLDSLESRAGLRWVLTHSLDVYRELLDVMGDRVQLLVLDFSVSLTEKLTFYMETVRRAKDTVPVILLATPQTRDRAKHIAERPIDRILERPFDAETLETLMGTLMGRSERQTTELKFWIFLEERIIEGKTTDVSASGMGGVIPDPILFARVRMRLFAPNDGPTVDLQGHVRRKQRLPEGGYHLGIEFQRFLEGDLQGFCRVAGVQLKPLDEAGEDTLAMLRAQTTKAKPSEG